MADKIGSVVKVVRGINIYKATRDNKTGYRITSVISKRLFATVAAAEKAINNHWKKAGYR